MTDLLSRLAPCPACPNLGALMRQGDRCVIYRNDSSHFSFDDQYLEQSAMIEIDDVEKMKNEGTYSTIYYPGQSVISETDDRLIVLSTDDGQSTYVIRIFDKNSCETGYNSISFIGFINVLQGDQIVLSDQLSSDHKCSKCTWRLNVATVPVKIIHDGVSYCFQCYAENIGGFGLYRDFNA